MKNLFRIAFCFLSILSLSVYAQQDSKETKIANKLQSEVGVRFMSSGGSGSSSVSGSALFTGHTSSSASPEFFIRVRPSSFSSFVPENLAIEGNISMSESVHEIKFVGASLGKKTCSQAMGLSAQWWFGESKSKVRPYVGIGFEQRDCGGDYAIGGARFAQNESSSNSTVFRAGIKFDLSDWLTRGLSASIDVKTSGKHESSGTPVAGTTITNKTGGSTSAGFGLQYSF